MSDQKDAEKAAPVAHIVTTAREHEADRKKAKRHHRRRFRVQLTAWAILISLAVLSYPIQSFYRHLYLDSCAGVVPVSVACLTRDVGLFFPSLVLAAILVWNGVFQFLRLHDWKVALSNAQQTVSPQNVTRGYTELFSIYVRTKRRSYHLMAWGLLAFVYAIVGTILNLDGSNSLTLYWTPQISEAVLGVGVLVLAYYLGSSYLPGDVIVRHTLALSIFAISNATNVEEPRIQAERDAEQFVRESPWWFYPG